MSRPGEKMTWNLVVFAFIFGTSFKAEAAVAATDCTATEPTSVTTGVVTEFTFTLSGALDVTHFKFEACAGTSAVWSTMTVTETSGKGTATLDADTTVLCFKDSAGASLAQTNGGTVATVAATSATKVTVISPTTIDAGAATPITFTIGGNDAADHYKFVPAADCTDTLNVWAPMTTLTRSVTLAYGPTGTWSLCYRNKGGSDSIKQTTSLVAMTVIKKSSSDVVTAISPESITVNTQTSVTFTGSLVDGDKYFFALNCHTILDTMEAVVFGTKIHQITKTATGPYKLCYRQTPHLDNEEQNGITLTVVAATSATQVTAIAPATIAGNVHSALELTVTGTNLELGDKFMFTTGECTTANTADLIALEDTAEGVKECVGIATETKCKVDLPAYAAGTYKLCFQKKGGSDIMKQTGVNMEVTAPGEDDGSNTTAAPSASVDECFPMRPTITCVLAVWLAF